jgi:hypothetical protein
MTNRDRERLLILLQIMEEHATSRRIHAYRAEFRAAVRLLMRPARRGRR